MIEYRKASVNEVETLAQIRIDFLVEANNIDMNEKDVMLKENERFIKNGITDGSFSSWVAENDGKIVATSGISFFTLPPNKKCPTGKVAYIANMFTYQEYRKQGIASKLFALTVEEAINRGCIKIMLNATDMGRPIYEKYGFKDSLNDMVFYVT